MATALPAAGPRVVTPASPPAAEASTPVGSEFRAAVLERYGAQAHKDKWLKPLLEGEIRSAFLMTEPQVASSDATNVSMSCELDGDEYVLNGEKWWSSGAGDPRTALYITMVRTPSDDRPRHRQHSQILVDPQTPGITKLRAMQVFGNPDAPHGHFHLKFENVRVPKDHLLGERGRGFAAAQVRLATARIHHCMRSIGGAELMIALMCERAGTRETFGRPIAQHDKIREFVALSRVEIDQARLLTLNAADALDRKGGRGAQAEISQIKLAVARACYDVADRAVQVFGAMGVTDDSPVADFYAGMRALRIYDGPDEVHVRTIARAEFDRQAALHPEGLMRYLCTDFSDRSRWEGAPAHG